MVGSLSSSSYGTGTTHKSDAKSAQMHTYTNRDSRTGGCDGTSFVHDEAQPAKLFVISTRPFEISPNSTPTTRFLVSLATLL